MHEYALLPIAKVVGTHGIRGYLKALSYAESMDPFVPGKELTFRREGETLRTFRIASSRRHKRVIHLALDGVASIQAAKEWVGCELCVEKTSLPQPEEGDYYWYQIIGLDVLTVDNRHLGRVTQIFRTGSNDVYVVRSGQKEVLIPAIDSVVLSIDLKSRVLQVDLLEGLDH